MKEVTVTVCSNCEYVFMFEHAEGQQTTNCGRCGKTHQMSRVKKYFHTDNRDAARQVRAELQADIQEDSEVFDRAKERGNISEYVGQVVSGDAILEAQGIDAEAVADAGERATQTNRSRSHKQIMREAITEQESPSRADVLAYATEAGVPEEKAESVLERMEQRGIIISAGGAYRIA